MPARTRTGRAAGLAAFIAATTALLDFGPVAAGGVDRAAQLAAARALDAAPAVELPDLGTAGDYDAAGIGDAIRHYHDSGRWARDLRQSTRPARRFVKRRLRQGGRDRCKPAIVLDVDDTALSQYRAFEQLDFRLERAAVGAVVLRAESPAIRPTLALYRLAQRRGVRVFFVTGRPEVIRDATETNLDRAGYDGRHRLSMRPDDDSGGSVVPYKSGIRRGLERRGFCILANVGDQDSDLEGGHAEQRFKLPNPMYFLR